MTCINLFFLNLWLYFTPNFKTQNYKYTKYTNTTISINLNILICVYCVILCAQKLRKLVKKMQMWSVQCLISDF